ncbi:hypothetical protein ACFVHS_08800 [Streptomyces sp. NPDC057746]
MCGRVYGDGGQDREGRDARSMLRFAGAMVDGEASGVYPPLVQSDVRY